MTKKKPVCPDCGSNNVHLTNKFSFEWNVEAQDWNWANDVGGDTYEYCDECGEEIGVIYVPIKEPETV